MARVGRKTYQADICHFTDDPSHQDNAYYYFPRSVLLIRGLTYSQELKLINIAGKLS